MTILKTLTWALLATPLAIGAVGCDRNDGPAERAGERVDEVTREVRIDIHQAGDRIEREAEQAGDSIERTADEAEADARGAFERAGKELDDVKRGVEEAGDSIQEAGREAKAGAEEAARDLEEALE